MTSLEKDLRDLLLALIAVDSQNPSLVSGVDGEGAIADLVTDWAIRAGLDVERIEPTPGRPSLLITALGHVLGRGTQPAAVWASRHRRGRRCRTRSLASTVTGSTVEAPTT